MAEGSKLDLLLDRLVDDLGDLHLGHLGLSHGVSGGDIGVVGIGIASVRISGERETSVGEDGGGLDLGLLISRPLTSGLTLGQAGNSEPEHVGAPGLLDSVSNVLDWDLDLLHHGLDDVGGVGEGSPQGVGVAQVLSGACCYQDRTHQLERNSQ